MLRDPLIYALTEINGDVRYIGKSVNGVVRAFKHFQPAQMARKCHRNSWLARWADPEWRAKITESMRRCRARGR